MIYINLILVFLVLVAIHEYGHYVVARWFKAEVTDFSIGFGKPLLKFTDKNGTTWKLSPIPLGGYVKIKGLDNIFSPKSNDEEGSFQSLTLFQKILVLLAGSIFNIFSAWFALFCIFFFFGIVSLMPIIGSVSENSSAFENDLREGDKILEINNISIEEFSDIPKAIGNNPSINILIERNNQIIEKNFDLKFNSELNRYIIGISSPQNPIIDKYNLIDSIKNSSLFIPTYYVASFSFLQQSYKENTLGDQLAGPIGIVKNADQMMLDQVRGVLFLFIIISLFVGLFNLLPIPLLDGGHIIYFIIRRIFSNSLPDFITRVYLAVGITIISFLFIVVTYNDIFYK
jgi:regulator of sigma E protease